MHLQLTGRLEPGETHATIALDAGDIFSGKKAIVLTLLNVSFCSQIDHDHFPPPVTAMYPVNPNRYQETVTVLKRSRREILVDDEPREKRSSELLPMQLRYYAGFRKIIFDFEIVDFKSKSPRTIIEQVLAGQHSQATMNHFQQLLKHSPRYELTESNERSKKKVQISLPPLTRILCNKQSFFGLLGYEPPQLKKMEATDVWYLENSDRTQSEVFLATTAVNTNLNFSYHLGKYAAENKYTINFQRLDPNFSSILSLDSFCERNATASLKLFQHVLEATIEILGLPSDSLQAKLVTADVISLDKVESLKNASDSEDNFGLNIEMGTDIHELIGTISDTVSWSLKKLDLKILPPAQTLSEEQLARCKHVVDTLKIYFLNQTSSNSIVQGWQTRYRQYLSDLEKSLVPPEGPAGDAVPESESGQVLETTNEAGAGPAGDSQLEGEKVVEETPAEKEKPPTEQIQTLTDQQQPPTEQVLEAPAEQPPTEQVVETPTEQVLAPTDQTPTQEQPPAAEEESSSASTEEPAVTQVETVVINNPARRPPTKYPVANTAEIHVCTNPNSFPENCTLVIREGEPFDYLATRGLCSVLGMVRKSRQPNVLTNDCVLKFGPNLSSLSLEIIDNAFNTFRITGTKSMWIKLDLQYVYLN